MKMIGLIIGLFFLSCETPVTENKEAMNTKKNSVVKNDTTRSKDPVQLKNVNFKESPEPTIDTSITVEYLMGKFDPTKDERFVKISTDYASNATMLLRKEAYEAFIAMFQAAKNEGISLQIISATRPFDHQKRIWEAKWNGSRKVGDKDLSKTITDPEKRALKILEYSSMPGSSRHHWGTDIDINALTNDYFEKGKGKKEYDWLVANAPRFGFCQPYSPKGKERPYGYFEEKWHWSYLPVSKILTNQYKLRIENKDVSGFAGDEVTAQVDIVGRYVLGISADCF